MEETDIPSNTKVACIKSIFEVIERIVQENEKHLPTMTDAYLERFVTEKEREDMNSEIAGYGLLQEIKFPTGETATPELVITEIIGKVLNLIIAMIQAGFSDQQIAQIVSTGAEFFTRKEDCSSDLLRQLRTLKTIQIKAP